MGCFGVAAGNETLDLSEAENSATHTPSSPASLEKAASQG